MTIFFEEYYNTGIGDTPLAFGGEELGFFDAMSAAYDSQIRGSNIDTYVELMTDELQPLIDAIQALHAAPARVQALGVAARDLIATNITMDYGTRSEAAYERVLAHHA